MTSDSNDESDLPHKLSLLTNSKVLRLCKTFGNNSLANIKWSKTQLSKIVKLERFLGILLGHYWKFSKYHQD